MNFILLTAVMCIMCLLLSLATIVIAVYSRRHWRVWLDVSWAALWIAALFGVAMLLAMAWWS